jgi:hypothetical protein
MTAHPGLPLCRAILADSQKITSAVYQIDVSGDLGLKWHTFAKSYPQTQLIYQAVYIER